MKNMMVLFFTLSCLFNLNLSAQDGAPPIQHIRDAVNTFFSYDAKAYSGYFVPEGEIVNPYGMRIQGQAAIVNLHNTYFKSLEGQTGHAETSDEQVDFLTPTIAVVTMRVDSRSTNAAGEEVSSFAGMVMATLSQEAGNKWKTHHFQITPILSYDSPDQG